MSSLTPKKSRLLETGLRPDLLNDDVIKSIKSCWTGPSCDSSKLESLGVEIVKYPFPVCVIRNFISSSELLNSVIEEVENVPLSEKSNDLYNFKQSQDLQNLKSYSFIPQLYNLLKKETLDWLSKVSGNDQLKQEISATFSSYSYQDKLLCHDDKCQDRHIAFILYLVEDWREEDGGLLQLFNKDNNGYPQEVVKSLIPEFNMMVLFEVTRQSFHQVSEVASKTKKRLSLNGWFHSSIKNPEDDCPIYIDTMNFGNDKKFKLEDYISPIYFDNINKTDIRDKFGDDSEIQLDKFLKPKIWETVMNDLRSNDIKWSFKGPANIRKYEVAESSSLPASLQALKEIFESKCWFRYLKVLTGLDFAPSENSDLKIWGSGVQPDCKCEIQRWTHSCYTLVHDKDSEFHTEGLDVIMRVPFQNDKHVNFDENVDDENPKPGHIIYIDSDTKEEGCLLHVGYKFNSLALVYRDEKTLRFTNYLNSTAEQFYLIFCVYRPWRPPSDQPNLRHCEGESETDTSCSPVSSNEEEYLSD